MGTIPPLLQLPREVRDEIYAYLEALDGSECDILIGFVGHKSSVRPSTLLMFYRTRVSAILTALRLLTCDLFRKQAAL
jgi:hypothetical protein